MKELQSSCDDLEKLKNEQVHWQARARFVPSRLLLPVDVWHVNIAFYGTFHCPQDAFAEGAWVKVPKTLRTFNNISLLDLALAHSQILDSHLLDINVMYRII